MSAIGTLAEAVLKLGIDGAGYASGLNKAEGDTKASLQRMSATLGTMRNVAAVAFGAGVVALRSFADAARDAEAQQKRFTSTFELMGPAVAAQIPAAERWAESLKKVSDFDDEDLLEGLGRVTAVTGNVSDGMLAMEAATDLARLKGIDLAQAQQLVIMGYNGQDRGLKKLIGSLGEGVKGHDALIAIQKRVAGGAEATADTVSRAEERMAIAWEDAREKLGKDLQPMLIQTYNWLSSVAGAMEGVNGQTIMWTTAISGLLVVGLSAAKWVVDFRVAILALRAATVATNAAGGGMLSWIGAMPVAIGAAIAAVAALIVWVSKAEAAWNKFMQTQNAETQKYNPSANTAPVKTGLNTDGTPHFETGDQARNSGIGAQTWFDAYARGATAAGPLGGIASLGMFMKELDGVKQRATDYKLRNNMDQPTPTQRERARTESYSPSQQQPFNYRQMQRTAI